MIDKQSAAAWKLCSLVGLAVLAVVIACAGPPFAPPPTHRPTPTPVPPTVTATWTPTPTSSPSVATVTPTAKVLNWDNIGGHIVIDPQDKYWEKYEDTQTFPGLYLRLSPEQLNKNPDLVSDYLLLQDNFTWEKEEGGVKSQGTWKSANDKQIAFEQTKT